VWRLPWCHRNRLLHRSCRRMLRGRCASFRNRPVRRFQRWLHQRRTATAVNAWSFDADCPGGSRGWAVDKHRESSPGDAWSSGVPWRDGFEVPVVAQHRLVRRAVGRGVRVFPCPYGAVSPGLEPAGTRHQVCEAGRRIDPGSVQPRRSMVSGVGRFWKLSSATLYSIEPGALTPAVPTSVVAQIPESRSVASATAPRPRGPADRRSPRWPRLRTPATSASRRDHNPRAAQGR